MGYICTNCNFRPKTGNYKICPYCEKGKIKEESSAEELLDDVDNVLKSQ
jgi:hypothetical protein